MVERDRPDRAECAVVEGRQMKLITWVTVRAKSIAADPVVGLLLGGGSVIVALALALCLPWLCQIAGDMGAPAELPISAVICSPPSLWILLAVVVGVLMVCLAKSRPRALFMIGLSAFLATAMCWTVAGVFALTRFVHPR